MRGLGIKKGFIEESHLAVNKRVDRISKCRDGGGRSGIPGKEKSITKDVKAEKDVFGEH